MKNKIDRALNSKNLELAMDIILETKARSGNVDEMLLHVFEKDVVDSAYIYDRIQNKSAFSDEKDRLRDMLIKYIAEKVDLIDSSEVFVVLDEVKSTILVALFLHQDTMLCLLLKTLYKKYSLNQIRRSVLDANDIYWQLCQNEIGLHIKYYLGHIRSIISLGDEKMGKFILFSRIPKAYLGKTDACYTTELQELVSTLLSMQYFDSLDILLQRFNAYEMLCEMLGEDECKLLIDNGSSAAIRIWYECNMKEHLNLDSVEQILHRKTEGAIYSSWHKILNYIKHEGISQAGIIEFMQNMPVIEFTESVKIDYYFIDSAVHGVCEHEQEVFPLLKAIERVNQYWLNGDRGKPEESRSIGYQEQDWNYIVGSVKSPEELVYIYKNCYLRWYISINDLLDKLYSRWGNIGLEAISNVNFSGTISINNNKIYVVGHTNLLTYPSFTLDNSTPNQIDMYMDMPVTYKLKRKNNNSYVAYDVRKYEDSEQSNKELLEEHTELLNNETFFAANVVGYRAGFYYLKPLDFNTKISIKLKASLCSEEIQRNIKVGYNQAASEFHQLSFNLKLEDNKWVLSNIAPYLGERIDSPGKALFKLYHDYFSYMNDNTASFLLISMLNHYNEIEWSDDQWEEYHKNYIRCLSYCLSNLSKTELIKKWIQGYGYKDGSKYKRARNTLQMANRYGCGSAKELSEEEKIKIANSFYHNKLLERLEEISLAGRYLVSLYKHTYLNQLYYPKDFFSKYYKYEDNAKRSAALNLFTKDSYGHIDFIDEDRNTGYCKVDDFFFVIEAKLIYIGDEDYHYYDGNDKVIIRTLQCDLENNQMVAYYFYESYPKIKETPKKEKTGADDDSTSDDTWLSTW